MIAGVPTGSGQKGGRNGRIYSAPRGNRRRLRGERPLVVRAIVDEDVELRTSIADGITQGVEALAGDRNRVAVVAGLPHPLAPVAAHRFEFHLHRCRLSQLVHVALSSNVACLRPAASGIAMPVPFTDAWSS